CLVLHPDTQGRTVFVYDGPPGGVGVRTRRLAPATTWSTATIEGIANCECIGRGPSCAPSPNPGHRRSPLADPGAVTVLQYVRSALSRAVSVAPETQP